MADQTQHMTEGDLKARRNARILAVGQMLGGSAGVIVIASAGIIGHQLAANKSLATLPFTLFVLGTALSTLPVNLMMRQLGRRAGYMIGAASSIAAMLVAAAAVYIGSFWLFALGLLMMGPYWAQVQSYRFAAADTATDAFRAKAISWVLVGGILSAFVGPQVLIWTKATIAPFLFLGTFIATAGLGALAILLLSFVDIPKPPPPAPDDGARPLAAIAAQPRFIVAAMCGAIAYAIMTLVMTASPLAMVGCGLTTDQAAVGIQWHVLAMFTPSLFTGNLINRFGKEKVVAAGMVLLVASAVVGLSGITVWHFWVALSLLGVGWAFGYIGATAMVTDTYTPVERNKVQGFNDFIVFGTNAVASLSSGILLVLLGWNAVNMVVFPAVLVSVAGLVWLAGSEKRVISAS